MNSRRSIERSSFVHVGKFYPPHMGGIETHLRDLVTQQSRQYPVEVLVANEGPSTATEYLDGARITRLARIATVSSMPICPALPRRLAGRHQAIVHLHLPNPWAAFSLLASRHTGKIFISHHSDTLGRPLLRKFSDPFVKAAMDKAAAIIVASQRYLRTSRELEPYRAKCHIVPWGIDPLPFETARVAEVLEIQERYGSEIILSIGRLVHYKGFEYLLRAMRNIQGVLLLIGTGPLFEPLQRLAFELGILEKVQLLGHVDNVLPYLQAAKTFVLPSISRAESFGIVQLEAMAAGVPVVNTDIDSGVPEVSLHGITGLTVPPKDADALAQAITTLLHNEDMRRQYGQQGIKRVRQHFSLRQMADSILELYDVTLADPGSKHPSGAAA